MISVCLAAFNGALYIKDQIHSILNQIDIDDELIISDNGSKDDTIKIINSFNDSRIKLINCNKLGIVYNFENAIKNAKGDIIFLSDQDDIWHENKVQIMSELISESNIKAVVSDCVIVDNSDNIIHKSFFDINNSKVGYIQNLYNNSYMGCCMCFKKELLNYILPFPKHIKIHDNFIGLIAQLNGLVIFYSKPLIKHRKHSLNNSTTANFKSQRHLYEIVFERLYLLYVSLYRKIFWH